MPERDPVTHKDIKATKAPLMEHLIELRRRLIWSTLAILIAFAVCLYFARDIYNLLVWPYRLAAGVDTPIEMIYTAPQEFFFTEMKLALFGAVFIAFPVIASQIYMFVAPGLYRSERQAFLPFLIATPILFLLGASLVYFVAMPLANLGGLCGGNGSLDRRDCFVRFRKTGLGVEVWRRHEKHALHARKSLRQTVGIGD